jgi:hypothetical protein
MSYQAVLRNADGTLMKDQAVSIQISILQSSATGTTVYQEDHSPSTNLNGLVSLHIGTGNTTSGTFSAIDWSAGPYFLQTDIDPAGGINYVISTTTELISVPFALYANKADSLVGGITEADPIFDASIAKGITSVDTAYWNGMLGSYVETDPIFSSSVAKGIKSSDTTYWNNKLDMYTETDPEFNQSVASGIKTADTVAWNNHLSVDLDTDTTNEIQTIYMANDSIKLSNGGGRIPLAAIKSYVNSSARSTSESVVHLSDSTTAVYVSNFDYNYWNYADSIILDSLMLKEGDRLVIYTSPTGGALTYHSRSYWQLLDYAGNKMNCFISARNASNNGDDGFNAYSNQSATPNIYYQDLHYTIPADGTYFIKRARYYIQNKSLLNYSPTPYRYPIGMWYYEIN